MYNLLCCNDHCLLSVKKLHGTVLSLRRLLESVGNKAGGYQRGRPLPIIPRSRSHDSKVTRISQVTRMPQTHVAPIGAEYLPQHLRIAQPDKRDLVNHGGGISSSHNYTQLT